MIDDLIKMIMSYLEPCDNCGKLFNRGGLIKIRRLGGYYKFYCYECCDIITKSNCVYWFSFE